MSITKAIFKAPNKEGTANELASHMPDGIAWEAKYIEDTNLRGLVYGMSTPINTTEQLIEELSEEFEINQTTLLIDEWEKSVGLPDECFGPSNDLPQRRASVIERLSKKAVVKLSEMQQAVDVLFPGVGIILFPGAEYFTFEYTFEVPLLGDVSEKFIIVAQVPSQQPTYEYDFEVDFTTGIDLSKLRCYLEKIIPSNVLLIIDEVGA